MTGESSEVTIETPAVEAADRLAGWWVAMANEQRAHCSHLLGEPNRRLIEEAMARHIVTDGLLVARLDAGSRSVAPLPSALEAPNGIEETEGLHGPIEGSSESLLETGLSERLDPARREKRGRGTRRETRPGEGGATTDDRAESVVGFVMFGPETGSYEQSVDRGIVENVFVHPDYRDRGIGGALLRAAERALADSGVDTIALEVMANNDAARRFYARRGYRPHRLELEVPAENVDSGAGGEDEGDGETGIETGSESDRHTNERDR